MLNKLLYCVQQLNANNSSTYKIKKFKELYDEGYINKELWNLIYDKDVLFHITSDKIDKNLNVCRSNKDYKGDIIELLKDLYVQYSGNTALAIACGFVNNNAEYKQLIYDVIDKDLHIGMTAKSINKAVPGFFPEFNVALASPNNGTMPDENCVLERKLDGTRCLCLIDYNGKVKLYSRKGKEFHTLDVLKKELEDFVALHPEYKNKVLDGEMCIVDDNGNEDFQGIMKEITRKDHTINNPSYCVFDLLELEDFNKGCSTETYKPRLNKLKTFVEAIKSSHIKLIEYAYYTPEIFATWQKKVLDNGWEGLIARKDVPYEGKRSRNLLKYKNFFDAEYVVKDVVLDGNATILVEGKAQRIKCVQSLVIEHKGYIVNVGSGLTQQQRIEFAEHPEHIIGKTITVQYFSETNDKDGNLSLRFPTIKYIYDTGRNV